MAVQHAANNFAAHIRHVAMNWPEMFFTSLDAMLLQSVELSLIDHSTKVSGSSSPSSVSPGLTIVNYTGLRVTLLPCATV